MSENCDFCGEPLHDGVCQNTDCPPEYDLPAMSDSAELFPQFSSESSSGFGDESGPALSSESGPALSSESGSALSSESGSVTSTANTSLSEGLKGPYLSLEQAATPIDHTGTIVFDASLRLPTRPQELLPGGPATRLTDDENYRDIQTVLKESIASDDESNDSSFPKTVDTSRVKALTNRPELSQTIRLRNPFESERTAHRLPSRSLSVPSDSASLEKRKQIEDDYNLDSKDYKIVAKVGEGGSGVVYEAQQIALRRRVAVKVLKQRRVQKGSRSRTATKELEKRKNRFLHEVNITAKLQHPNIIPLYDLGVNSHGEVFYSMKLINSNSEDGVQQSWASLVRASTADRTSATIERNVQIFEKVCDAIRYAHAEQVVHRDLKPDNVMVGNFGEVLVIDWGMALDLSNGKEPFTAGGTTSYMPPEMGLHYLKQSELHKLSHALMVELGESRRDGFVESVLDHGNHYAAAGLLQDDSLPAEIHNICRDLLRLDAQEKELASQINYSSDIYLLGAILYEIAVGHPPHYVPMESCKSVDEKHHREFWLSSNHKIQRLVQVTDPLRLSLCNIALAALQKNQADRYRSVDDLKEALKGFKNQVQSLQLVETGRQELAKAQGGEGYLHLLPALESFRGAETLFPLGDEAQRLQIDTACEYARRATRRKDFDAGLSILDEYVLAGNQRNPDVLSLAEKLKAGKRAAARNRRLAAIGWLAAVVLPVGVWVASWMLSAQLRSNNVALQAQNEAVQSRVNKSQAELVEKENALQEKRSELTRKDEELASKTESLEKNTMLLTQNQQDLLAQETKLAEKSNELVEKSSALAAKTTELTSKESELTTKNSELASAQTDLVVAKTEFTEAQKQVEQLKFTSAEGRFNSLILPIPLDLRKGNLELAVKRLQTLKNSELNPQFKNGWVARHFAKAVNVSGVETQLGENASVIDVLHGVGTDLILAGTQNGKFAVWQVNSATGETTRLSAELPTTGSISQASLSANGQWLAISLDDVLTGTEFEEPYWLVNLKTGKRVGIPTRDERNDSVVGCRSIGFVNDLDSPDEFQLVSVEELSAYNGLKQRLQVATRRLKVSGQELSVSVISAHPIAATTRDERRVDYVATMNLQQSVPTIAVVYASLDSDGRDRLVLESLVTERGIAEFASAGTQPAFQQQTVAIGQYPTAMHVTRSGLLYCGHADGRIDQYEIGQLTETPKLTTTEHESAIAVLASSANGMVVSGAQDGVMVVLDRELQLIKRLIGQMDALTAISIADSNTSGQTPDNTNIEPGFQLVSGGSAGQVRVWEPESTLHDATIRKEGSAAELRLGGDTSVTCGAVDVNWVAAAVPASAYGTSDGRVVYFNSVAMRSRGGFQEIPAEGTNQAARINIPAPPGSFDTSFGNFDSFGIVGDQFVLLQSNGQLFSAEIDARSAEPSSQIEMSDATSGRNVAANFVPLLATVKGQSVFFTNNPVDEQQILVWQQAAGSTKFRPSIASTKSRETGRVKRIRFSPDGRWLAVVREVGRTSTTGEYVTEIMQVDLKRGAPDLLSTVTVTNRYRVGDPAFVGFSADSRELIFHFHKAGVDRETWTENWALAGDRWQDTGAKQRIDDRRVDLVAWDGDDTLVTKINRRFYLSSTAQGTQLRAREFGSTDSGRGNQPMRSVQPTGADGSQYVLFNESLELFSDRGEKSSSTPAIDLSNARDVRVFGDRAIVLDDAGFHLIDADLNYVTLIARRKIATSAISLSNGRLAVSYDIGGLCRILDVTSEKATEIGRFGNASQVQLSPDGKWAACRRNGELQIFAIDSKFEQPGFVQPIPAENWAARWIGTSAPNLLVAIQSDDGSRLEWKEIDPRTGATNDPAMRLPAKLGLAGRLTDFELAPHSRKYVSLIAQNGNDFRLGLWALSPIADPVSLNTDAGFQTDSLNPVAVSFSEIDRDNKTEIGTRLIVLNAGADSDGGSAESVATKIFLLADEQFTDSIAKPIDPEGTLSQKTSYRVFEIEGVIDVTDGRKLIDAKFSGDGRSLLEVDDRGVKLLLSKDW